MENKNISFAVDELDVLMAKVARVHGASHPELIEIKGLYEKIREAIKNGDDETVKSGIKKAAELSDGFLLPEDACTAYTRVYKAFKILGEEYK